MGISDSKGRDGNDSLFIHCEDEIYTAAPVRQNVRIRDIGIFVEFLLVVTSTPPCRIRIGTRTKIFIRKTLCGIFCRFPGFHLAIGGPYNNRVAGESLQTGRVGIESTGSVDFGQDACRRNRYTASCFGSLHFGQNGFLVFFECIRRINVDVSFLNVFAHYIESEGRVGGIVTVAGGDILCTNLKLNSVVGLVIGGDEVENEALGNLCSSGGVKAHYSDGVSAGRFGGKTQSGEVLSAFFVKLKFGEYRCLLRTGGNGVNLIFYFIFLEFAGVDGILDAGYISAGFHIDWSYTIGGIIGLQSEAEVYAGETICNSHCPIVIRRPSTQSGHEEVDIEEEPAIAVIVTDWVITIHLTGRLSFFQPVGSHACISEIITTLYPIPGIVVRINRCRSLFERNFKPVTTIIVVTEILFRKFYELIAIVVFFTIPTDIQRNGRNAVPESFKVTVFILVDAGENASLHSPNLIVLQSSVNGAKHLIPTRIDSENSRLPSLGIQHILPGHNQHVKIQVSGFAGILGSIIRISNFQGGSIIGTQLGLFKTDFEGRFCLSGFKSNVARLEDTFRSGFYHIGNGDGVIDIRLFLVTGNGDREGPFHFRVIGMTAGGLLGREVHAVASFRIGLAGLIGFLFGAAAQGKSSHGAKHDKIG